MVNKLSRGALILMSALAAYSISARQVTKLSSPTKPRRVHNTFSKRGNVEMVLIPARWFWMGDDDVDDNKRHRLYLDAYEIGKTPITVKEFRAYCSAKHIKFSSFKKPSVGWTDDNPMVNVNWRQARSYCRWTGGDLPTEAQWEKAARGTDARKYPWGDQWDGSRLQWSWDYFDRRAKMTASVTAHPAGASPFGCLDMAGNVSQWCLDCYVPITSSREQRNPVGRIGQAPVLRGGSFGWSDPNMFRSAFRGIGTETLWNNSFGLRLASRLLP